MRTRVCLVALVAAALVCPGGCEDAPEVVAPPPKVHKQRGKMFDPARTGEVCGKVLWSGARPVVQAFRSIPEPLTDQPPPPLKTWPNPNAPQIDVKGGLAHALVWLRHVDSDRARPWDLPPARIEIRDQQFHVLQGNRDSRVGFVRAGDKIEMESRDAVFHSVQVRGLTFFTRNGRANTFFTATLPQRDKAVSRQLDCPEIVELSSGCGYFWMRAYLLVSEHPHVAVTDASGAFVLPRVPPGAYEIVAWRPSWQVVRTERNPDNMRVQQVRFGSPLEARRLIEVEPGRTTTVELSPKAEP